jgi:hypothetical protein
MSKFYRVGRGQAKRGRPSRVGNGDTGRAGDWAGEEALVHVLFSKM